MTVTHHFPVTHVHKSISLLSLLHTHSTVILSWFVEKNIADSALRGGALIEEEHVECRPEKVSDAVLDENVDVTL